MSARDVGPDMSNMRRRGSVFSLPAGPSKDSVELLALDSTKSNLLAAIDGLGLEPSAGKVLRDTVRTEVNALHLRATGPGSSQDDTKEQVADRSESLWFKVQNSKQKLNTMRVAATRDTQNELRKREAAIRHELRLEFEERFSVLEGVEERFTEFKKNVRLAGTSMALGKAAEVSQDVQTTQKAQADEKRIADLEEMLREAAAVAQRTRDAEAKQSDAEEQTRQLEEQCRQLEAKCKLATEQAAHSQTLSDGQRACISKLEADLETAALTSLTQHAAGEAKRAAVDARCERLQTSLVEAEARSSAAETSSARLQTLLDRSIGPPTSDPAQHLPLSPSHRRSPPLLSPQLSRDEVGSSRDEVESSRDPPQLLQPPGEQRVVSTDAGRSAGQQSGSSPPPMPTSPTGRVSGELDKVRLEAAYSKAVCKSGRTPREAAEDEIKSGGRSGDTPRQQQAAASGGNCPTEPPHAEQAHSEQGKEALARRRAHTLRVSAESRDQMGSAEYGHGEVLSPDRVSTLAAAAQAAAEINFDDSLAQPLRKQAPQLLPTAPPVSPATPAAQRAWPTSQPLPARDVEPSNVHSSPTNPSGSVSGLPAGAGRQSGPFAAGAGSRFTGGQFAVGVDPTSAECPSYHTAASPPLRGPPASGPSGAAGAAGSPQGVRPAAAPGAAPPHLRVEAHVPGCFRPLSSGRARRTPLCRGGEPSAVDAVSAASAALAVGCSPGGGGATTSAWSPDRPRLSGAAPGPPSAADKIGKSSFCSGIGVNGEGGKSGSFCSSGGCSDTSLRAGVVFHSPRSAAEHSGSRLSGVPGRAAGTAPVLSSSSAAVSAAQLSVHQLHERIVSEEAVSRALQARIEELGSEAESQLLTERKMCRELLQRRDGAAQRSAQEWEQRCGCVAAALEEQRQRNKQLERRVRLCSSSQPSGGTASSTPEHPHALPAFIEPHRSWHPAQRAGSAQPPPTTPPRSAYLNSSSGGHLHSGVERPPAFSLSPDGHVTDDSPLFSPVSTSTPRTHGVVHGAAHGAAAATEAGMRAQAASLLQAARRRRVAVYSRAALLLNAPQPPSPPPPQQLRMVPLLIEQPPSPLLVSSPRPPAFRSANDRPSANDSSFTRTMSPSTAARYLPAAAPTASSRSKRSPRFAREGLGSPRFGAEVEEAAGRSNSPSRPHSAFVVSPSVAKALRARRFREERDTFAFRP